MDSFNDWEEIMKLPYIKKKKKNHHDFDSKIRIILQIQFILQHFYKHVSNSY